jgi:hypothetical protein
MMGSSHTHPNVVTVGSYFFQHNGRADFKLDPSMPKSPRVFTDACLFLQVLLEHLNPIVHLKLESEIENVQSRFYELIDLRFPNDQT